MLKPLTSCTIEPAVTCVGYPPPGWHDRWNRYLGLYVNTARHHHGFSRLRTPVHPMLVVIKRGGDSLSLDGRLGFVEIAPGTFGHPDYLETFSFLEDHATHAITLSVSDRPSVYERPRLLDDPQVLPPLLAVLVRIALSGGLIVVWPAYGRTTSLRLAVAGYLLVLGTGIGALFGLRAFGAAYFDGVTWPLDVVRVCAFLTIPACLALVIIGLRLRRAGHGRPGAALASSRHRRVVGAEGRRPSAGRIHQLLARHLNRLAFAPYTLTCLERKITKRLAAKLKKVPATTPITAATCL